MRFHLCLKFLLLSLALHCVVSHPTMSEAEDGVESAVVEQKEALEGQEVLKTASSGSIAAPKPPEGATEAEEEPDLEKELSAALDRVEGRASLELMPGATLEALEATREGRSEGAPRGATLGERVEAFLRTHVLKLKLPVAGDVEEGRGRLKRLLLPFVLLLKLVAAILLPIFTSGIALISLKGLWAGLAAGLLAGALGLRELLLPSGWAPHAPRVTVLRPHVPVDHVYHGADYLHHGWSRTAAAPAAATAASLALDPYRGYGPASGVVSPAAPAWDTRSVLH